MNSLRLLIALGLLGAGCNSLPAPNPDLGGPPESFNEYEASTEQNSVSVSAFFEPNYEDIFKFDLLKAGVIPIKLSAVALDERAGLGKVRLKNSSWNPRLFLQDGTALRLMSIDELKPLSKEVFKAASKQRFTPGDLRKEIEGFLFFKIEPKDAFRINGRELVHKRGATSRGVDLYHSLLSFIVTIEDESFPFFIGIKPQ